MRLTTSYFRVIALILLAGAGSPLVGGCSPQVKPPTFDSAQAFDILQKQCAFGPRPPGSPAHDQTRDYLAGELRKYADAVELQNFTYTRGKESFPMTNIIARFGSLDAQGILLCAHWDTRPTADQELDKEDQQKPILGANDGASGVAVLLELARMLKARPPGIPVTIVLFDGEDLGPTVKDMFVGSEYFAARLSGKRFRYGILLDMVGDKNLEVYREGNSQDKAVAVNDKIWAAARKLGISRFKDEVKYTISDDHLPLIKAGVPTADVIDFDYAYWHTLRDTVDKCSAQSLRAVGETIAQVVYSEQTN